MDEIKIGNHKPGCLCRVCVPVRAKREAIATAAELAEARAITREREKQIDEAYRLLRPYLDDKGAMTLTQAVAGAASGLGKLQAAQEKLVETEDALKISEAQLLNTITELEKARAFNETLHKLSDRNFNTLSEYQSYLDKIGLVVGAQGVYSELPPLIARHIEESGELRAELIKSKIAFGAERVEMAGEVSRATSMGLARLMLAVLATALISYMLGVWTR